MPTYCFSFDGALLQRGFWIYVWRIDPPNGDPLVYVGRTGDTSSCNAQSPFKRVSGHLDPREQSRSNALTRNLRAVDVNPETCRFSFVAIGPVLDEAVTMDEHIPRRNAMAALERKAADWLRERQYRVLGNHPRVGEVDQAAWQTVQNELEQRFPQIN